MQIRRLNIHNFRSIAELQLDRIDNYTSISGRNNAGKTNVVSAILAVLSAAGDDDEFELVYYPGIIQRSRASMRPSLPVWLRNDDQSLDKNIRVEIVFNVDPVLDGGIIRFLETVGNDSKLGLSTSGALELGVVISAAPPDYKMTAVVSVGTVALDSYRSEETLRKLRSMAPFYYHNSVEMNQRYVVGHTFRELVGGTIKDKVADLGQDWRDLTAKLTPVLDDAKSQLAALLGRLEDRFSLGLSIHDQLSPAMLPISVSLEDNTKPVPMEQWGSGTRNRTLILAHILNAIRRSKANDDIMPLVIIEEPELTDPLI